MTSHPDPLDQRVARASGWLLVGVLVWLCRLTLPIEPAPPELDPSWQQGLSYALAHGFQFGRDVLFTFGPLGGPAHARFQPEIFWPQVLLFEFAFKGLLVVRWIAAIRRWPSALDRAAFLLLLCIPELGSDAFYFASIVALASLHGEDPPPRRALLLLDLLLIASIGWIKFTYFVLAVAVAGLLAVHHGRRGRRAGLLVLAGYGVCATAVWTACGQAPWNLPVYVARSLALAMGYSEAQAWDGPWAEVVLGLACLGLLAALAAFSARSAPGWRARVPAALVVLAGACVAFKASFTYHAAHGLTYFGYVALAACALRPPDGAPPGRRIVLGIGRACSFALCVAGLSLRYDSSQQMVGLMVAEGTLNPVRSVRGLLDLPGLEGRLEAASRELSRKFDLPRIRALVGSQPVDFLGSTQGWVLLNGLDWKPRPVFQSYLTVAPSLTELNARRFAGPDAPPFVVLELGVIDHRLAGTEDSGALQVLLADYVPAAVERGLVLLRRDPERAARPEPTVRPVEEREARFGEVVRLDGLPGEALRARFDVRYSLLGRLRKLVYHAPITWARLELSDGTSRRARLVPGMLQSPVLLRPYVEGNDDWIRLHTRGLEKSVVAFSVLEDAGAAAWYEPTYRVVIERCDDLLPRHAARLERELAFGGFPTQPFLAVSDTEARSCLVGEREVALVGPSSHVAFEVEPGDRRLTGALGILEECLGLSDGVDFAIALKSAEGELQPILELALRPRTAAEARVPLDLRFVARPGDRLLLSTKSAEGSDWNCDLAYWEAVRIE